jgi:hypothetical protein
MSALAVGGAVFVCVFGGALLGMLLKAILPYARSAQAARVCRPCCDSGAAADVHGHPSPPAEKKPLPSFPSDVADPQRPFALACGSHRQQQAIDFKPDVMAARSRRAHGEGPRRGRSAQEARKKRSRYSRVVWLRRACGRE